MRFGAAAALVLLASSSAALSLGAVELGRRVPSRREQPPGPVARGESFGGDELVRMRAKNARRKRPR